MHGHRQTFAIAAQRLRSEADLRNQHQRLPTPRQAGLDRRQIDLGLAAAGDAIEQQRLEASERSKHGVGRRLLSGVERWCRAGRDAPGDPLHRSALRPLPLT